MSNEISHTIDTAKDMFTTAETLVLESQVHNHPSLKDVPQNQLWVARNDMRKKIYAKWRVWLWESYGESLPDFIEPHVWDKAWKEGHSDGLHQVEWHFQDLCDFARNVCE